MLAPEKLRSRVLRHYPDFLRSLCTGKEFFPLNVIGAGLIKPTDFARDRAAIDGLRLRSKENADLGYEITWEERNYRRIGAQNVPKSVVFRTREDFVGFLKKQTEVKQFQADYRLIVAECSTLKEWVVSKPLKVVEHAGDWAGLLRVCTHLRDHPQPNCYLRELPVTVDTKFIEKRKGILSELLPLVAHQMISQNPKCFEDAFGFRQKQPLVRMRFLDEELRAKLGFPIRDFSTPLNECSGLPLEGSTVLIVENEMTFLTLPSLQNTIAIFGAGDAAALLGDVSRLNKCRLFYWGDLDSHGFETLSNLRSTFSHVASLMMDEATLSDHIQFVIKSKATRTKEVLGLTAAERALYQRLVAEEILLEQERIHNVYSNSRLAVCVRPQ